MATRLFYQMGMICSVIAFILMFVSFASPYWYKSWTRVHSPFANIGLWHVCLSGFTMPRDPVMKSYVGCWWIHSSEFELVADDIMPAWFRIIQTLCVFTLLCDLCGMVLILVYLLDSPRKRLYDKDRGRMFIVNSILMLVSAFLVFLIALIFAEMSHDSSWMPRPWMNYLSWSYGFCVLSGFFAAFGGMFLFILGLIYKDKDKREEDRLPESAAEMRRREHAERAREKEEEAMTMSAPPGPRTIPPTRFAPPHEREMYGGPPPIAPKPGYRGAEPEAPKVGESFV
ncbi:hypothetical protein BaRGS_00038690 [Batillaria attramentaria]|uniref:Uncharacterized protein n=1 Tax=Batillaria attramentaria TaxID=370345 RepID=A0ABD0J5R0_9CAEN